MINTTPPGPRLRPLLDQQRSAWRILNLFAETPSNEISFARRFPQIDESDREFLAAFYNIQTPWETFERVCVFWNVPLKDSRLED